jgi:hypothetical protein
MCEYIWWIVGGSVLIGPLVGWAIFGALWKIFQHRWPWAAGKIDDFYDYLVIKFFGYSNHLPPKE